MNDALQRLELAVAAKEGFAGHGPGSQGLCEVAAQDVIEVAKGIDDRIARGLAQGAAGALVGWPEDADPLKVHQRTCQVRHLITLATLAKKG